MKKLDKYIIRQFITAFIFAITILAVVSCVIDYAEKLDAFVKNNAPVEEIVIYFINFIPHIIALLFPLFIFISTIFFTSKLAYRSEFIAMQASGIKLARILRPYFISSILIASVSLIFNHFIVPNSNKIIYQFEEQYIRATKKTTDANVHIRLSPQQYVFVNTFNFSTNSGERFTEEFITNNELVEKTFAQKIFYNDSSKVWTLTNVTVRKIDGLNETLTKLDTLYKVYNMVPKDLSEDDQRKATLTSNELRIKSNAETTRGLENVNAYGYELHRRTSESVAGVILTIIGVLIATRKIRGGSGLHLAIGIVISAIYMLFLQFTKTFAINSGLDPMLAAWIPNIIFTIVAFFIFRWRNK